MAELLQGLGCAAAGSAVALALAVERRRLRAGALLAALALAFALLLGEGWDALESLRERPALLAAVVLVGAAGIAGLAVWLRGRGWLLALALIAALPVRVPIEVGGEDVNLLLPLYALIGAGALGLALDALRGEGRSQLAPRPLTWALAAAIALYALQASYSEDLGFAARNVGFFLVPFAAMFALLAEQRWTPRLLGLGFAVVIGESLLFALVGIGQAAVADIFWNPALERSNDFHFYFRVNSLFWDPNIYGRYLALAAVLVVAVLAWSRKSPRIALLAATLALLLAGLVFAYSQTSFVALLFGTAAICALRWSLRWTAIAAPVAAVAIFALILLVGGTSESEDEAREISSGRTTLIEGGAELAAERPLWGHGSASFAAAFAENEEINPKRPPISHNEPVTVAAEQGAVGVIAYAALLVAALWALLAGMRRLVPGLGARPSAVGDPAPGAAAIVPVARIAVLTAFVALLVHTIGYAGYLTDPLSWALLAIGGALAQATVAPTLPWRPFNRS